MKKVISLLISIALMLVVLPIGAYAAFPDIAENHWAYASVEKLVSVGTINGMPDGSFNPTGVVSRGEFVKMLGKSDIRFEQNFADVPESFDGFPIALVTAGLMALAFMGFSNLQVW